MLYLQEPLQGLTMHYQQLKWLVFPSLISSTQVDDLLTSLAPLPTRTVICGDPTIRFGQQDVPEKHPLAQFFQDQEVVHLVLTLLQAGGVQRCQCWTSVYGPGQYINAHRDRAGHTQLVVCLQSPSDVTGGGSLLLTHRNGHQRVFLTPGDAVLFEATTIEHATTALQPTEQCENPKRIVAVGRYFLDK